MKMDHQRVVQDVNTTTKTRRRKLPLASPLGRSRQHQLQQDPPAAPPHTIVSSSAADCAAADGGVVAVIVNDPQASAASSYSCSSRSFTPTSNTAVATIMVSPSSSTRMMTPSFFSIKSYYSGNGGVDDDVVASTPTLLASTATARARRYYHIGGGGHQHPVQQQPHHHHYYYFCCCPRLAQIPTTTIPTTKSKTNTATLVSSSSRLSTLSIILVLLGLLMIINTMILIIWWISIHPHGDYTRNTITRYEPWALLQSSSSLLVTPHVQSRMTMIAAGNINRPDDTSKMNHMIMVAMGSSNNKNGIDDHHQNDRQHQPHRHPQQSGTDIGPTTIAWSDIIERPRVIGGYSVVKKQQKQQKQQQQQHHKQHHWKFLLPRPLADIEPPIVRRKSDTAGEGEDEEEDTEDIKQQQDMLMRVIVKSIITTTTQSRNRIHRIQPNDSILLYPRKILSNDTFQYEQDRLNYLKQIDDKHMSESYDHYDEQVYNSTSSNENNQCIKPKWAFHIYTNCNNFHELAMERLPPTIQQQQYQQQHPQTLQQPQNHPQRWIQLQQYNVTYLAHGYYRETYLFQPYPLSQQQQQPQQEQHFGNIVYSNHMMDPFVLKHIRLASGIRVDYWYLHSMHSEALVMERLSGSNRISQIYGFCATSTMVQPSYDVTYWIVPHYPWQQHRGRIDQIQLDKLENQQQQQHQQQQQQIALHNNTNNSMGTAGDDGVFPFNHFSPVEKAYIALSMAEALAEMHGYKEGVLVHDDFHPDQFLISAKGEIILNDINNAEALRWNVNNHTYCKYWISYGGDFRAPEEYRGDYIDESVDIWPMGNMIFSLLTGLWPYYRQVNEEKIEETTMKGYKPYLNPKYFNRSYVESRLLSLMERCYQLQPSERVDIFFIVQYLRDTIQHYWEYNQIPVEARKIAIGPPPSTFHVPAP